MKAKTLWEWYKKAGSYESLEEYVRQMNRMLVSLEDHNKAMQKQDDFIERAYEKILNIDKGLKELKKSIEEDSEEKKVLEGRLEKVRHLVDVMIDDCSAEDVELYQNLREILDILDEEGLRKETSSEK